MYKHKKAIIISYTLFILCIVLLGCKKDSVFRFPLKPVVTIYPNDGRLNNQVIHFVKDTVYVLASNIVIDSGHSFLVDAGTLIKVNSNIGITIKQGAIIEAKGTMNEPIVFTLNAGRGKQLNQGNPPWVGLTIFGSNTGKSSGILSFVRLEFSGAYNAAIFKHQSSLWLLNINKKTVLDHIQVSHSYTSSFEFSGGDCNSSNLLSYASLGTDFLINGGYKGNLQYLLAYRYISSGSISQNLAGMDIEDTGTLPVVSNLTVIGPTLKYSISSGYLVGNPNRRAAIITSNGCKFHIRNTVVIGYPQKAYYLDAYITAKSLEDAESDIAYCIINPIDTSNAFYLPKGIYSSNSQSYDATDLKNFLLQPKFYNEIFLNASQFMLTDPYNYFDGILDPMPKPGSPLLTGANFADSAGFYKNTFFKPVVYRGALGLENWLKDWVNFVPLQTDYNN